MKKSYLCAKNAPETSPAMLCHLELHLPVVFSHLKLRSSIWQPSGPGKVTWEKLSARYATLNSSDGRSHLFPSFITRFRTKAAFTAPPRAHRAASSWDEHP